MSEDVEKLLTPEQLAERLGISKREVLAHSKGRGAKIPRIQPNDRVVRYHWGTVLKALSIMSVICLGSMHGAAGELRTGARMIPDETHRAITATSFAIPEPVVKAGKLTKANRRIAVSCVEGNAAARHNAASGIAIFAVVYGLAVLLALIEAARLTFNSMAYDLSTRCAMRSGRALRFDDADMRGSTGREVR